MSPEEFARQQEIARQQEQLRRRSSGLEDEPEKRRTDSEAYSSGQKLARSQPQGRSSSRSHPSTPARSSKPVASPGEHETGQAAPQEQPVPSPLSELSLAAEAVSHPSAQAPSTLALQLVDSSSCISLSPGPVTSSDGLADLDTDLAIGKQQGQAPSPLSSLSGLPSWGSLDSSGRDCSPDMADGDPEVASQRSKAKPSDDPLDTADMAIGSPAHRASLLPSLHSEAILESQVDSSAAIMTRGRGRAQSSDIPPEPHWPANTGGSPALAAPPPAAAVEQPSPTLGAPPPDGDTLAASPSLSRPQDQPLSFELPAGSSEPGAAAGIREDQTGGRGALLQQSGALCDQHLHGSHQGVSSAQHLALEALPGGPLEGSIPDRAASAGNSPTAQAQAPSLAQDPAMAAAQCLLQVMPLQAAVTREPQDESLPAVCKVDASVAMTPGAAAPQSGETVWSGAESGSEQMSAVLKGFCCNGALNPNLDPAAEAMVISLSLPISIILAQVVSMAPCFHSASRKSLQASVQAQGYGLSVQKHCQS